MCGRYVLYSGADRLAALFGLAGGAGTAAIPPRFNIAPGQTVLVIVCDASGETRVQRCRWGFETRSRAGRSSPAPINARSETAADSAMFAAAVRSRRCIVPADGFFEWQSVVRRGEDGGAGASRQPWLVTASGHEMLGLAGIWEPASHSGALPTMAILTRDSTGELADVHSRMPVILGEDDRATWLDGDATRGEVEAVLRRSPPALNLSPVSTHVNDPTHDDPACIEPVEHVDQRPESDGPTLFGPDE